MYKAQSQKWLMPDAPGMLTTAFVVICLASSSYAQTTLYGGRGMLRVFSAETIQSGSIFLNSFYLAFFRSSGNQQSWNLGVTYGMTDRVELTSQVVPYQDDQKHDWGPPGDTQIGFKWQLPLTISRISTGLRAAAIFPTALQHNAPFEPYSANQVAWSLMGLLTFDLTNYFGSFPLKIHTNFGYLDHNIETFSFKDNTEQLLFGFGLKVSARPFIMYTEYTGEFFLNNEAVRLGANSMRLTQGFKFIAPFDFIADFGLDVGLSQSLDNYRLPLHQYADWKIFAGLTYHFKTSKVHGYAAKVTKIDRGKESKALEEIMNKRKKVDRDLLEKRKSLEKQGKKNQE